MDKILHDILHAVLIGAVTAEVMAATDYNFPPEDTALIVRSEIAQLVRSEDYSYGWIA